MKTYLSFYFYFAFRNHPLARECDIVETLHMRLTLLQMTFGKHIERKHVCFFAGEVRVKISIRYIHYTFHTCICYYKHEQVFRPKI